MSDFTASFRGLFAVVRHTAPPPKGKPAPTDSEPMTIVFPVDTGGLHGLGAHGGAHGTHHATLYVPEQAVPSGELHPLTLSPHQTEPGFIAFSLQGWILRLPLSPRQELVYHQPDQPFAMSEPRQDDACAMVGKHADWRPLSRLANLNELTSGSLAVDLARPDPLVVESIVRLSGGKLECSRSFKALRDAFFEFFTDNKTLAIQPAAEDVAFTSSMSGDRLTLGLSPLLLPDTVVEVTLPLPAAASLFLSSLPPHGASKPTDLNHFFNFYPLMKGVQTRPFLRVLARCDEEHKLFYTMPGIDAINLQDFTRPPLRTDEHCTCLTAQVFTTQAAL